MQVNLKNVGINFPVAIIDDDYNSPDMRGILIRMLAENIKKNGMSVVGGFKFSDANQAILTFSEVAAVVISVEGSEAKKFDFDDLAGLIAHIHRRDSKLPVFLCGEQGSLSQVPPALLTQIHGVVYLYEDTKDFVAKQIVRAASEYADGLLPPFFKALVKHASESNYSWHTPGHAGGVAFTKSAAGRAFHQFFGENTLRSDLSISVPELGSLLDHSGPVADAEKEAAKVFGADLTYFVTNGTSTANKIVWHSIAREGDVVFIDRNCHKSLLHSMIMTGATPVYFQPSRNAYGIIGPISLNQFTPEDMARRIAEHPLIEEAPERVRMAVVTNSTYDGICYNASMIKKTAETGVDYLHFDEAWYAYGAFHDFYAHRYGMSDDDGYRAAPAIFTTQSTHKLLAAFSQASMVHIKQGTRSKVNPNHFNESFMMHTSTSPHYGVIASCDIAGRMMKGESGRSLIRDIHSEAMDFRRAMEAVGATQKDWWFGIWQPDTISGQIRDGAVPAGDLKTADWVLAPGDKWHGFDNIAEDYVLIDPIKVTVITPGLSVDGNMDEHGIPGSIVSNFLWERGIVVEKTGLYSFLVLFSLGITKGKWSTLVTELLQFKHLYDSGATVAEALPSLVTAHPETYVDMPLKTLCDNLHGFYRENNTPKALNDMYTELPDMVMTPAKAYRELVSNEVEAVPIDELDERIAAEMIVPYPPGIPLIMPGERYNQRTKPIVDYLKTVKKQNALFPGFEADIHGLIIDKEASGPVYKVSVIKKA